MAEKWQKWMPLYVDRFRASQRVQAMHPAARCGFIYLLLSAWQSEDCALSADPIDLANESGLGDELWAVHGPRILRMFVVVEGRLRNEVCYVEWMEAKTVFEKRRAGAHSTNSARIADAERAHSERIADTDTDTDTEVHSTPLTPQGGQENPHGQGLLELADMNRLRAKVLPGSAPLTLEDLRRVPSPNESPPLSPSRRRRSSIRNSNHAA